MIETRRQGGQDVAGLGGNGGHGDKKVSSVRGESICTLFLTGNF